MALSLESVTWLHTMVQRGMVLCDLLTLLIHGIADDFLASCRHTAKRRPTCTVKVAGITDGHCGGFIGAGLLFEIISTHTAEEEKGGGKVRWREKVRAWYYVLTAHSG